MIDRVSETVTTEGAKEAATGEAVLSTPGGPARLLAVKIDYTGEPATTDVELIDRSGVNGVVLTRSNTSTDGTFRPILKAQDEAGADVEGEFVQPVVDGLIVKVAGGDPDGTVRVDAFFENT